MKAFENSKKGCVARVAHFAYKYDSNCSPCMTSLLLQLYLAITLAYANLIQSDLFLHLKLCQLKRKLLWANFSSNLSIHIAGEETKVMGSQNIVNINESIMLVRGRIRTAAGLVLESDTSQLLQLSVSMASKFNTPENLSKLASYLPEFALSKFFATEELPNIISCLMKHFQINLGQSETNTEAESLFFEVILSIQNMYTTKRLSIAERLFLTRLFGSEDIWEAFLFPPCDSTVTFKEVFLSLDLMNEAVLSYLNFYISELPWPSLFSQNLQENMSALEKTLKINEIIGLIDLRAEESYKLSKNALQMLKNTKQKSPVPERLDLQEMSFLDSICVETTNNNDFIMSKDGIFAILNQNYIWTESYEVQKLHCELLFSTMSLNESIPIAACDMALEELKICLRKFKKQTVMLENGAEKKKVNANEPHHKHGHSLKHDTIPDTCIVPTTRNTSRKVDCKNDSIMQNSEIEAFRDLNSNTYTLSVADVIHKDIDCKKESILQSNEIEAFCEKSHSESRNCNEFSEAEDDLNLNVCVLSVVDVSDKDTDCKKESILQSSEIEAFCEQSHSEIRNSIEFCETEVDLNLNAYVSSVVDAIDKDIEDICQEVDKLFVQVENVQTSYAEKKGSESIKISTTPEISYDTEELNSVAFDVENYSDPQTESFTEAGHNHGTISFVSNVLDGQDRYRNSHLPGYILNYYASSKINSLNSTEVNNFSHYSDLNSYCLSFWNWDNVSAASIERNRIWFSNSFVSSRKFSNLLINSGEAVFSKRIYNARHCKFITNADYVEDTFFSKIDLECFHRLPIFFFQTISAELLSMIPPQWFAILSVLKFKAIQENNLRGINEEQIRLLLPCNWLLDLPCKYLAQRKKHLDAKIVNVF